MGCASSSNADSAAVSSSVPPSDGAGPAPDGHLVVPASRESKSRGVLLAATARRHSMVAEGRNARGATAALPEVGSAAVSRDVAAHRTESPPQAPANPLTRPRSPDDSGADDPVPQHASASTRRTSTGVARTTQHAPATPPVAPRRMSSVIPDVTSGGGATANAGIVSFSGTTPRRARRQSTSGQASTNLWSDRYAQRRAASESLNVPTSPAGGMSGSSLGRASSGGGSLALTADALERSAREPPSVGAPPTVSYGSCLNDESILSWLQESNVSAGGGTASRGADMTDTASGGAVLTLPGDVPAEADAGGRVAGA